MIKYEFEYSISTSMK